MASTSSGGGPHGRGRKLVSVDDRLARRATGELGARDWIAPDLSSSQSVVRYVPKMWITQEGVNYPGPGKSAFDCPHCGAFAQQISANKVSTAGQILGHGQTQDSGVWTGTRCVRCEQTVIWRDDEMMYPAGRIGPRASSDMPADALKLYEEARAVGGQSPRSAAALLRLATEVLVNGLDPAAGTLYQKIGRLQERGLAQQIVDALDVLRVIGNNAVHPGEIVMSEQPETVGALFAVLNHVVTEVVTKEREIRQLKKLLPEDARAAIERRDAK